MLEQATVSSVDYQLTTGDLHSEFDAAMDEKEFDAYRSKADEIKSRFAGDIDELRGALGGHIQALQDVGDNLAGLARTPRAFLEPFRPTSDSIFLPLLLSAVIMATLFASAGLREAAFWVGTLMGGGSLLYYAAAVVVSIAGRRVRQRAALDNLEAVESAYVQERARLVREAMRRQVTESFRDTGMVTAQLLAPTLVELSTAKIASSRTHQDVVDFILGHETSAIGIAGSRGAGKSTLIEAVRNADGVASHHVLLTAPVKYEPHEFVRRLFADVAKEIVHKSGHPIETSEELHRRRLVRQRTARDVLTLGLFFVLTALVIGFASTGVDWNWDWRTTVGLAAASVLAVMISATAVSLMRNLFGSAGTRSALVTVPRSVRLAVEALDLLTWSREEGQKETGSTSLLGGMLALGGEDTVTRKQRELSQPEMVARFREMLTQFSRDRSDERFVIFIDELDKLEKIDDLVNAINGIKDLLHLPGVHFVVSVSVDALVRFEERGMAARDAFDSAFDTVIRMRRLTLDESRRILDSRAANFPAVLTLCCHAWSGGLARDLLRTARRCVEIHGRSTNIASEIVGRVVIDDVVAHIENALRVAEDEQVKHLVELRRTIRAVADGADPLWELQQLDAVGSQADYVALVGLALLGWTNSGPASDQWWDQRPEDWEETVEALANAMAVRAEPAAIREEMLKDAVDRVLT
jgi:predicted AAA+ superfamily ATPase